MALIFIYIDKFITIKKFGTQIRNSPVQLVCRKRDAYASCAAVARSFPLYDARSRLPALEASPAAPATPPAAPAPAPAVTRTVTVEIQLVKEERGGQ